MNVRSTTLLTLFLTSIATPALLHGDEPAAIDALAKEFEGTTLPLLKRYCLECHSAEEQEGDLDLERFSTLDHVRTAPRVWQGVAEMLDRGEMPPKEARQPVDAERARLRRWVRDYLATEARLRAGDPGRVVLRRLNNAEYTYTLRDLTGLEALEPAREFPVDGAAGEGFTNTGNALVMSPSLVTKYLGAAKDVAGHAVLLPDGFRFSPETTPRDWTEEILARLRSLYGEFTDARGADTVNLQGIVLDTNQGGRLPVEKYLAATIAEREALASGGKTVEAVALERGLNARYLGTLWKGLTDPTPSLLLDGLRARWKRAKPEDLGPLAGEIAAWQKGLWKFGAVGHIGKANGPKAWMEPVNPLIARQEVRFKIPPSAAGKEVTLSIVATDAGDGHEQDVVTWQRPRLVAPGRPDLLLRDVRRAARDLEGGGERPEKPDAEDWGPDPSAFGRRPDGAPIDPASLCLKAPALLTFRLPAGLVDGAELVATGVLEEGLGAEGSVQLEVVAGPPPRESGLLTSGVTVTKADGPWSSNNQRISYASPILVNEAGAARRRIEAAFDDFRRLFPAALCYPKIVPVDEVVTLTLFYRQDDHLARLMLDEPRKARLDRLWDELHFVSRDALTLVDAFAQLMEYATQDADPKVFEPLRKPIIDRAAAFRQRLSEAEPRHLDALLSFAARAYRRPLTGAESGQLRQLYRGLRDQEIPHDEAFRLTLARVLVAPAFLYRVEKPGPGSGQGPASGEELATRLSYFLWSSRPDDELSQLAASGKLGDPEALAAQARRMLRDPRTRRLSTEFAAQWLHISGFDQLDEKSERHFPTFLGLRAAMSEESTRFFTDLFQNDGSVLGILDSDHTFLNEPLAKHYGIPLPPGDSEWRRVDGIKRYGRGGILAQSTTLAKQSGASRTSPTLRGNWISEVLLGERLPRPPKGVPQLPEDEAATEGLTVRQLVEQHGGNAKCAVCHQRIDPFGFSLEGFDAIGRLREMDLGNRPIDTRVKAMDGARFEGLEGLRRYLLTDRREAFVRQFCRKLLGFALGRQTQLSDEALLEDMESALKANGHRVGSAIDAIVRSRQFREIRGLETAYTD